MWIGNLWCYPIIVTCWISRDRRLNSLNHYIRVLIKWLLTFNSHNTIQSSITSLSTRLLFMISKIFIAWITVFVSSWRLSLTWSFIELINLDFLFLLFFSIDQIRIRLWSFLIQFPFLTAKIINPLQLRLLLRVLSMLTWWILWSPMALWLILVELIIRC